MTFAEAMAVPCAKIFGCGIGTARAPVLDRTSAVASAIVLSFIAALFYAAFDHLVDNITLQAGVS
jgi:hypothetical protein